MRSNLVVGSRAKPETIAALLEEQPALRAVFRDQAYDSGISLRPTLALAKALAECWLARSDLNDPDVLLKGLDVQMRVVKIALRAVKIHGVISAEDVARLMKALQQMLVRFLPPEQVDAAYDYCKAILLDNDRAG